MNEPLNERAAAVVVGGGPAGAATAIALARGGHSAVLVGPSRGDERYAGEVLRPEAKPVLSRLGLWDRFLGTEPTACQTIQSAWGDDDLDATDFIFNAYGPAWHVDRGRFDAMLVGAAEALGVAVIRGGRVGRLSRDGDAWHVEIERDGQARVVEASLLVDATGRSASVARSQGVQRRAVDRLLGLVGRLAHEARPARADGRLLLEAVEHGWWYSVPHPDGSMIATFMTDPDRLDGGVRPDAVWSDELGRTHHTAARLDGGRLAGRIRAQAAGSGRLDAVAGPGWLAVGDAACTYDPLSGVGLLKALESGSEAATAIAAFIDGEPRALEAYQAETFLRFDRYLTRHAAYHALERRWPDAPFWRRRQIQRAPVTAAAENGR